MCSCQSSFIIQPYRRKYLKSYFEIYSKDNPNCLWDDNVASVLEEQGFSIVDDPRSVYKVEKLYEALAKYEPRKAPQVNLNDADVKEGVRLAYACFARTRKDSVLELSAFTPELVYRITSNKKGSAGLTAWGQTKAESYVRAYDRGLQQILGVKKPDPCVAFKRTQFNDKTRLVWGYPYAMTAEEGIFARPLIEKFKCNNTPMAFAMPTGVLGTKLRVSSYHKQYAYSTDVKSFDSSISQQLIWKAFDILSTWFDLDQVEPTSGVKYCEIWKQVKHYFVHTPIVMPDGNVYKGKIHGVPSGSYFTQMVDSICNVIITGAIGHHFSMNLDKSDIFVLGDDVLFWSDRDVSLNDIAKYASSVFGAQFNADKSAKFKYDEPVHYLGRDWINGVPDLPLDEILKRAAQPERYRKYSRDPVERDRQVKLLLLSYAATYRSANSLWVRSNDLRARYNKSLDTYELLLRKKGSEVSELDPDFQSGLVRFRLKYLDEDPSLRRTPLALQFWK